VQNKFPDVPGRAGRLTGRQFVRLHDPDRLGVTGAARLRSRNEAIEAEWAVEQTAKHGVYSNAMAAKPCETQRSHWENRVIDAQNAS
jgi:hypothetical protein